MKGQPRRSVRAQIPVDDAIEECVRSRRNFYLGLWAGRQLALSEQALRAYATSVVKAAFEEPRDEDIIRRLGRDFAAHGYQITREEIVRHLRRTGGIAIHQFAGSD